MRPWERAVTVNRRSAPVASRADVRPTLRLDQVHDGTGGLARDINH